MTKLNKIMENIALIINMMILLIYISMILSLELHFSYGEYFVYQIIKRNVCTFESEIQLFSVASLFFSFFIFKNKRSIFFSLLSFIIAHCQSDIMFRF